MKKLSLVLIGMMSPLLMWAQGLLFENGTFSAALEKAKAEHKIVFLDVYTTWCGPCKQMAANLFPTKEAGTLYNKHFVNYKIDAEKGEGIEVAARYNVAGYPTNLFLRPDGSVVYTVMGAGDLPWFLNNANIAIEEAKDPMQWSDYEREIKRGKPSKTFLEKYISKGKRLSKNTDEGLDLYVSRHMPKKLNDKQIGFLLEHNSSMDNAAYALLAMNKDRINELKKNEAPQFFKYYSESLIKGTIEKFAAAKDEDAYQKVVLGFVKENSTAPNMDRWFYTDFFYDLMNDAVKQEAYKLMKAEEMMQLPLTAFQKEDEAKLGETIANVKMRLAQNGSAAAEQEQYVAQLQQSNPQISKIASLKAASDLNEMAWTVYETNNRAQLGSALKWSSRSLELIGGTEALTRASFLDTYAHLLYRNGEKKEAILQQEQAVALARSARNTDAATQLEESLKKMKDGNL